MPRSARIHPLAAGLVGVGLATATLLGLSGRALAAPASTPTVSAPALTTPTVPALTGTTVPTDSAPTNAPDVNGATSNAANPASPGISVQAPTAPQAPASPSAGSSGGSVSVNLGSSLTKPSSSITIIVLLTLLTVAPSLLIMMTSFSRIIIVLSLTRQALGLQSVPPNQVLAGLALFMSLFIMAPTLHQMNQAAIQPYLHGQITAQVAYDKAQVPLKDWMLKQTRTEDIALFESGTTKPASPETLPLTTVVPAFMLSEIRTAFIIGFVIFIPFLVIDLVVSSTLMSMGMMMLPPSLVSLPFKLLLFVLVDGWALVVKSLLNSFH